MKLIPTNADRANWAREALAVFAARTYSGDHPDRMVRADLEAAITDLMTDLLHLARANHFNPTTVARHAMDMFVIEEREELLK